MNYANMIEEKNLKKTFIIATLCSTLIGTFTSSMGLWDRVNDKRRQKKRDTQQDGEIKQLREKIEKTEKESKKREEDLQKRIDRGGKDEVGDNFERSGALIRRQYDEGYERLGRRFAVGDTLTENQLQAQIIALQQTVIQVLQDALYNDRQLTRADQAKIVAASNAAREGSLEALRQQAQRLGADISPQRALPPPKRASTVVEADPLFCRYSLDLQYIPNKPLAASFAPGRDCRCPACGVRLAVDSDDFWLIGKRTPIFISERGYEQEVMETREFQLGQRFVVKCHTVDGEYACVICNKHRDVDAICRTPEALANHVGNYHDVTELERELDLREKVPLALPPPVPSPPLLSPGAGRQAREIKVIEYR